MASRADLWIALTNVKKFINGEGHQKDALEKVYTFLEKAVSDAKQNGELKIVDYTIIDGHNENSLVAHVRGALGYGWNLYGFPSITNEGYFQAMVKYEDNKEGLEA